MQILKFRWVNGGGRCYDRRLMGMKKHGSDISSNSFLRATVKDGYHIPSGDFPDGISLTPDVLLGTGPTATRYRSTHMSDFLDNVEFASSQLIRKLEKQFLMEKVKEQENIPGSRVQLFKARFGRKEMFPVFMGETLSPFTDPDEGVKYEVFGEPDSQYFGNHDDANDAVTRASTKKVALTGKCMPTKYCMKTITIVASNCKVIPANLVQVRPGMNDVAVAVGSNAMHLQGALLQYSAVSAHRVTVSPELKALVKSFNGGHGVMVDKAMVPIPCGDYTGQKVIRLSSSIRSSRPVDHPMYEQGYPTSVRRAYEINLQYTNVPYNVCQKAEAWSDLPQKKSELSAESSSDGVKGEKSVDSGPSGGNPYVSEDVGVVAGGGGKMAATAPAEGKLFKTHFGKSYGTGAQYKSMGVKQVEQSLGYTYKGQTVSVQSPLCESMGKGAALQELILRGCLPFTTDENGVEHPRCNVMKGSEIPLPGRDYREDAVRQSMGLKKKNRSTRNAIVSDYALMVSQSYRGILTRVVDTPDREGDVVYQDRLYKLYRDRKLFMERIEALFKERSATTIKDRYSIVMENMQNYPWAFNLQISAAGGGDKILGQYPESKRSLEEMGQAQRSVAEAADMTRGANRLVNELCVSGRAVQLYLNVTQYEATMVSPGVTDVTFKKKEILKFNRLALRKATQGAAGGNAGSGSRGKKTATEESLAASTDSARECVVGCVGMFEVLKQITTRDMDVGMFLAHTKRLPSKAQDYLSWIHNGHAFFILREVYNPVLVAVVIATGGVLEKFYVPDSPYLKLCESIVCEGETRYHTNRLVSEADISRQFIRYACGAGMRNVTANAEFLISEGKTPEEDPNQDETAPDHDLVKVRYGVPMWKNPVWSQIGMEVNSLVENNGFMLECFTEEQQETDYFHTIRRGTLPDETHYGGSLQRKATDVLATTRWARRIGPADWWWIFLLRWIVNVHTR